MCSRETQGAEAVDIASQKIELEKKVKRLEPQLKALEARLTRMKNSGGNSGADSRAAKMAQELADLKKKRSDLIDGFTLLFEENEEKLKAVQKELDEAKKNLTKARSDNALLKNEIARMKNPAAKPKPDPKGDAGKNAETGSKTQSQVGIVLQL